MEDIQLKKEPKIELLLITYQVNHKTKNLEARFYKAKNLEANSHKISHKYFKDKDLKWSQ